MNNWFLKWLNVQLKSSVTDLSSAFSDGVLLMQLVQVLYPHAKVPPFNAAPKMRAQSMDNVASALRVLQKYGPELSSIGAEDLVDGDRKMVMGMLWTLIHHTQIKSIQVGAFRGREALLLWCNRMCKRDDISVVNFNSSWFDGLALCSVVDGLTVHGDAIDMSARHGQPPKDNVELALKVAEQELGVPALFSAEEFLQGDEKSLLAYVAALYRFGAKRGLCTQTLPEDGALMLDALAGWSGSKSGATADALDSGAADVTRWKELMKRRRDFLVEWCESAFDFLEDSKDGLHRRGAIESRLTRLKPLHVMRAILSKLKERVPDLAQLSEELEFMEDAEAALEGVEMQLADLRDAEAAQAAKQQEKARSAVHVPQTKLAEFKRCVAALLSALAATRSTARTMSIDNGTLAALDAPGAGADNEEQRRKETVRAAVAAIGDVERFRGESEQRTAPLLGAAQAALAELRKVDSSAALAQADATLLNHVAETERFVTFCVEHLQRRKKQALTMNLTKRMSIKRNSRDLSAGQS